MTVRVHGFPTDKEECRQWIDLAALPNSNLTVDKVTEHIGVCTKHWPPNAPTKFRGKYLCPAVPPSIFSSEIPKSCLPPVPHTPRSTSKSLNSARNPDIDQTLEFLQRDSFATLGINEFHSKFCDILSTKGNVACDVAKTEYVLLSPSRDGPVFNYTIILNPISSDDSTITQVKFESFHKLKLLAVPYGDRGFLSSWSQLTEVLRYVSAIDDNDKNIDFILRQIQLINAPKNTRLYDQNDLCQAFSWYARSRALYADLRDHIQLSSIATLKRIFNNFRKKENPDSHEPQRKRAKLISQSTSSTSF